MSTKKEQLEFVFKKGAVSKLGVPGTLSTLLFYYIYPLVTYIKNRPVRAGAKVVALGTETFSDIIKDVSEIVSENSQQVSACAASIGLQNIQYIGDVNKLVMKEYKKLAKKLLKPSEKQMMKEVDKIVHKVWKKVSPSILSRMTEGYVRMIEGVSLYNETMALPSPSRTELPVLALPFSSSANPSAVELVSVVDIGNPDMSGVVVREYNPRTVSKNINKMSFSFETIDYDFKVWTKKRTNAKSSVATFLEQIGCKAIADIPQLSQISDAYCNVADVSKRSIVEMCPDLSADILSAVNFRSAKFIRNSQSEVLKAMEDLDVRIERDIGSIESLTYLVICMYAISIVFNIIYLTTYRNHARKANK